MHLRKVMAIIIGGIQVAAALFFILPAAARCVPVFSDADAAQCGALAADKGRCQLSGLCRYEDCIAKDPKADQATAFRCYSLDSNKCSDDPNCQYFIASNPDEYANSDILKKEDPIQGDTGTCLAKIEPDKYQFVCNRTKVCDQARICYWKPKDAGAVGGGAAGGAGVAANCPVGRVCLDNPLQVGGKDAVSASEIIGGIIKGILGIIGAVTFAMFIWGGKTWLTSAGNVEAIEQGTQTMIWAFVGTALIFISYIILNSFFEYLSGAK